jgi:hypothetical protein
MKISSNTKLKFYDKSPIHLKKNKPKDSFSHENIASAVVDFGKNKAQQNITRFAQELNINDIRRKNKSISDSMFTISDGTALLIAYDKKIYKSDDDYITKVAFRNKAIANLKQEYPGQEIFYKESVGISEIGNGFYATLPLFRSGLGSIGMGFGFSAGIIMRYRNALPIIKDNDFDNKLLLPLSSEDAKNMRAGQEFELCGQGRLRVDIALSARYGAQAVMAVAGAQLGIAGIGNAALEYSITIIALNTKNKVRVIIRKLDQESAALSSSALAGLIVPANSLWPGNFGLPQLGHGLLKYMVEHKGNATFESYLSDYTTLSLNMTMTNGHKSVNICSYDIDLSHKKAAEAYNNLLQLDMSLAQQLAYSNEGIKAVELQESQYTHKRAVRLALCAEKLFLRESLRTSSHGVIKASDGKHKIYDDKSYKKHRENYISGQSDVIWEVVTFTKDDGEKEIYYRFNFKKNDFFTRQKEINKFFIFAKALGISFDPQAAQLIKMSPVKKVFSREDDTQIDIDIYFNKTGIFNIINSSKDNLVSAFLSARAYFDDEIKGHPFLENNYIYKDENKKIFMAYWEHRLNRKLIHVLKQNYYALNKRSLHADYKAWIKALAFARLINTSKGINAEQSIVKLFTTIGRSQGHHYRSVLLALIKVAQREHVFVHTLKASGGGVNLISADEGAFSHPRNEMLTMCMSA